MKKFKEKISREGCSDLTREEFQDIYRMRSVGKSIREISRYLKRSTSTVCEALNDESLKRSDMHLPWYEKATVVYESRRRRRGRPRDRGWGLKNEQIRQLVYSCLENKLSPKSASYEVSKRLKQ